MRYMIFDASEINHQKSNNHGIGASFLGLEIINDAGTPEINKCCPVHGSFVNMKPNAFMIECWSE